MGDHSTEIGFGANTTFRVSGFAPGHGPGEGDSFSTEVQGIRNFYESLKTLRYLSICLYMRLLGKMVALFNFIPDICSRMFCWHMTGGLSHWTNLIFLNFSKTQHTKVLRLVDVSP